LLFTVGYLGLPLVCDARKVVLVACNSRLELFDELSKLVALQSDLFELSFCAISLLWGNILKG
jgi:hypothetical protein